MNLIKDVIRISGGYSSYVDLTNEYFDKEQNNGRMETYRPIAAHRLAFENIANSLNPKDKRCYFLSGSYGTGKSHLCLMVANYFANPSNDLHMAEFFKHYADAQKDVLLKPNETLKERKADELQKKRKDGKYLVAICRKGLNLEFEGTILRSIESALKEDSTDLQLNTHFKEALRKINEWESKKDEKRFLKDLENELNVSHQGWTMKSLKKGITDDDESAMKVFKSCFKEITSTDFTYDKDNLQDILKDILTNKNFKENYLGIVIIYDEFGYALDGNLVNLSKLHDFAEFCANSFLSHLPLIFIGTGHKPFRNHGQVGDEVHYVTLEARVNEISLQTQGMEDIIAAIVQPKEDEKIWKANIQPKAGIFTSYSPDCKRLNIFNWLPAPKLVNNIIKNIYPMHPLATYSLLQLAKEVGSDNRSVFKFFSPEFMPDGDGWKNIQEYSYPWFVDNFEILNNNKLQLYTSDLLYDYFKSGLDSSNKELTTKTKTSISNFEATLTELNKYLKRESDEKLFEEADDLMYKILKVMIVNEIISTEESPIINTKENIYFALDAISDTEKSGIDSRLRLLSDTGILYNNQNVFEFRRSDIKDIQRMIDEFKAIPENRPTDLLNEFLKYSPLKSDEEFLESKDYNTTYNEDKRLKVIFVNPSKLNQLFKIDGKDSSYYEFIEDERKKNGFGKLGYEGSAVYIFCQNDEDIATAKKAIKSSTINRIIFAVPKKGSDIIDLILTLQAIDFIKKSKEAENFGPHENALINTILKTTQSKLNDVKESYFNNKLVDWFNTNGSAIAVKDNNKYDSANYLMNILFAGKRNKMTHPEFNKTHIRVEGQVKKILYEAGDILADLSKSIRFEWNLPENRGSKKYLQKCFVDYQVLSVIDSSGDIRTLDVEKDINKFKDIYPVYTEMLNNISTYENQGWIKFKNFINNYYEEYGYGDIAIVLFILLIRRYYGDSLRFKREENALTDLQINNTEAIYDILNGNYPEAVFCYEQISNEQKEYFNLVHNIFSKETVAGKYYSLFDAFNSIKNWWESLSNISKVNIFYDDELKPIVELLNKSNTSDPYTFVKKDILEIFGILSNELITADKIKIINEYLNNFKTKAETTPDIVNSKLRKEIAKVFSVTSELDIDLQTAIKKWFDGLDGYQKDPLNKYHNNESKPLIVKISSSLSNINDLLFSQLPESYGFGCVKDWVVDNSSEYINKIKSGKILIEDNPSKVGDLKIKLKGEYKEDKNEILYKGILEIIPSLDNNDENVYYTDNGSDPSDSKSERKALKKNETLKISGNKTIKFVVCDKSGNYGKTYAVEAIDESKKYLIQRNTQITFGDEVIKFIFPKDEKDAIITLTSLIQEIFKSKIISKEQMKNIIEDILKNLK